MSRHVSMDPKAFFALHHPFQGAGHFTGTGARIKWLSEDTAAILVGDRIKFRVVRTSLIYS